MKQKHALLIMFVIVFSSCKSVPIIYQSKKILAEKNQAKLPIELKLLQELSNKGKAKKLTIEKVYKIFKKTQGIFKKLRYTKKYRIFLAFGVIMYQSAAIVSPFLNAAGNKPLNRQHTDALNALGWLYFARELFDSSIEQSFTSTKEKITGKKIFKIYRQVQKNIRSTMYKVHDMCTEIMRRSKSTQCQNNRYSAFSRIGKLRMMLSEQKKSKHASIYIEKFGKEIQYYISKHHKHHASQ